MKELKEKMYYEKPSDKKRRKRAQAAQIRKQEDDKREKFAKVATTTGAIAAKGVATTGAIAATITAPVVAAGLSSASAGLKMLTTTPSGILRTMRRAPGTLISKIVKSRAQKQLDKRV